MKLIVGLGNPGKDYLNTRHNFGFMVIDALVDRLGAPSCTMSRWQAETSELNASGEKVLLMKPQTYMNNSGAAVGRFVEYYKVEPKDIWVISDDLDLPLGTIRVRDTGSSGGHNGLKSINDALGTEDYYHIRLGIGQRADMLNEGSQAHQEPEASIFVLDKFSKREEPLLQKVIAETADLILKALEDKKLDNHSKTVDQSV